MSDILTFSFGAADNMSLQYHPDSIRMVSSTNTSTVAGLERSITYVPAQQTFNIGLTISTYLTVLEPDNKSGIGLETKLIGLGIGAAAAAIQTGGKQVLDAVESVTSTISLAKGVYDLASGLVSAITVPSIPTSLTTPALDLIVAKVHEAMVKVTPFTISWDVAEHAFGAEQEFVISNIDVSTESFNDDNGKSMMVNLKMTLIKHGVRVEVI